MRFSAPKLEDCTEHGPGTELFIVEGDSAARTINRLRRTTNQAVFPMQGKPMNATKAGREDLLNNAQFSALSKALGMDLRDPSGIRDLRYERYILLFDPDADGIHSRTLMLLFFYKYLRPILDAGRVFDAHAPQWQIHCEEYDEPIFAQTENHFTRIKEHLRANGIEELKVKRFRGLASVGAEVLFHQCVSEETRSLSVLSAENAELALDMFESMRDLGRGFCD